MALTDFIRIKLTAGKGGDGVIRWRQEKFIPRGGPAGGDGGRGGSIYVSGIKDNTALQFFAGKTEIKSESGLAGGSKGLYGENGDDLTIQVPIGTFIKNLDTGEEFDIDNSEPRLLLKGGRGGLGNIHFKSATNQTPYEQTDGKPGESFNFTFELRLIADAGLIGLPNAGKSSLLNFLTNSKSKIGSYEFTTLEPHLGTLVGGYVLADIPGLIEGASEGKGLGYKFLQHITRTKILLHCLALDDENYAQNYKLIRRELENYSTDLAEKPEQIVLTKSDTVDQEVIDSALKTFPNALVVSVLDDDQLKSLQDTIIRLLRKYE